MAVRRVREARVPCGNPAYYPNRFYRPRTDTEYRNSNSLETRLNEIIIEIKSRGYILTRVFLDRVYPADHQQKYSLLIEATLTGKANIVKVLLSKFRVSVDKLGDVIMKDQLIAGVTALWCACAIGDHQIASILVRNGANVDFMTQMNSSTLRTDVDIHNLHNSSCLMAACYFNNIEIADFLLINGADIDQQTNKGGTAMHFIIHDEDYKMAKILISHNPMLLEDDQSLTPILAAALVTNHAVINFFLSVLDLSRQELVDGLELYGASCMNNIKNELNYGWKTLGCGLAQRLLLPELNKTVLESVERYNNQIESKTPEDYSNIIDNDLAKHYEGLIISERILGETHPKLIQPIVNLCKHFRIARNFKSCSLLYFHALKISIQNKMAIHEDILRFTEMYRHMLKLNADIQLTDLINILITAHDELYFLRGKLSDKKDKTYIENLYHSIIMSTLGFICLISDVLGIHFLKYQEDPETVNELMKVVKNINNQDFRTKENQTFLHLSLNHKTSIDNKFIAGVRFPNYCAMKLLVDCEADVDAVDINKNTPLHYIGCYIKDFPNMLQYGEEKVMRIVLELLDAGAHTDLANKFGDCPHTGYLSNALYLTDSTVRSLKCISASVLNKLPEEYYNEQLPLSLSKFTNLH